MSYFGVGDIRAELAEMLGYREFVEDKSGVRLVEVHGASFEADEETIFGEVNKEWCEREVAWYRSESLNVNDIKEPIPAIWKQVADKDGFINSNYGWCVWSGENGLQGFNVLEELKRNPTSRRAVAIYTRPTMWHDYNKNGRSDFCCTNAVQYLIRNGQLQAVVQMRSNDAVFGYKGDYYWQQHMLEVMASCLQLEPGFITWQVGSLHVYERHFFMVDHWSKTGETSIRKAEYRKLYPESEWSK